METSVRQKRVLSHREEYNLLSAMCIFIAVASWILNCGAIRLLFLPGALIHSVMFVIGNHFSAAFTDEIRRLRYCTRITYITYVLHWLFLWDIRGDLISGYAKVPVFFGLAPDISKTDLLMPFLVIALLALLVNLVCIGMQYVIFIRERNKKTFCGKDEKC